MVSFGYTLSSEEHGPADLVANAREAEQRGFDFVSISDHYHPWISAQGHSPFVWSVLGAVAHATERIEVGVGVTCPIMRIHPAVIAHATATTALLLPDRFVFGVGTGEALNEHILGDRWPRPQVRLAMLEEAVDIIRQLWSGDTVDYEGEFYEVENARLFDPPAQPPPIVMSGFGEMAVKLAGRIADGYWGHTPDADPIDRYVAAGGTGPRYAQIHVCWAPDAAEARRTVHEIWPTAGMEGQLSQDLPTWTHFEAAAEMVTEQAATESVPCGPDVEPLLAAVEQYVEAGYDHVYFHQIGPDQEGFFDFWTNTVQPALGDLAGRRATRRTKRRTAQERSTPTKQASGKNPEQSEPPKDKGRSKQRAATIANSPAASKHGGEKSHSGSGKSNQGGTTAQHKTAGRKGGKATAAKR